MIFRVSLVALVLAALGLLLPSLFVSMQAEDVHPQCALLQQQLTLLKQIQERGGWAKIPGGNDLELGIINDRVPKIRQRLKAAGVTSTETFYSDTFDLSLEEAVKRFQETHGLPVTGKVEQHTLEELNVSVSYRIRQVLLNIQRLEKIPGGTNDLVIIVNVARGLLTARVEEHKLSMKVIVGKPYHRTPEFNALLTSIEFNPWWVVPPGIFRRDILPALRKNKNYLAKNNMVVYLGSEVVNHDTINWIAYTGTPAYTIKQKPGPSSPMGSIKFHLPNPYYVYLHDTPNKELFDSHSNMYSSGCIRLAEAPLLATFLLARNGAWNAQKTESMISSGKNVAVRLPTPPAVYVTYITAWVNDKGDLNFTRDIYGRDARDITDIRY